MNNQKTGAKGEIVAAEWLERHGYIILETNWRSGRAELDIIARHNKTLVFVEVKTRSSENHEFPESAVSFHKQKSMMKAAVDYIRNAEKNAGFRFDIVSITLLPHVKKLVHFKDAFFPFSST